MDKLTMYRSSSPVKNSRKGEYKVQFSDASEFCKNPNSTTLGKPPEIPRSSSSSLRSNGRPCSSTSSSVGSLNTCYGSSVSSKFNRGSSASRNDSFGSTTSLDRRRSGGSSRHRAAERTLQPICDVARSESLVECKRHDSSPSDASGTMSLRRRRDPMDNKYKSPYASPNCSHYRSVSGERARVGGSSRPKTCHASPGADDINKTLVESNGERQDSDWSQRAKRAASRSPNRKSVKSSSSGARGRRESEKENDKNKERLSRHSSEKRHNRERGRSLKRQSASGRIPSDQCNNNL